ncbi:class I SAM-dependent methyltransferase [Ferrovibrio xuzhouensis]|uniref:Class I SAM-dependent methyltransferase n=1 Tax=Ferrovibrio xuzhouensis TaxID=1576914 RepID=A0ABV7VM96_9PROT
MMTTPRLMESDLPALYSQYYPRASVDYESMEREANLVVQPRAAFRRWLSGTDNQGHYLARAGQTVLDIGSGACLSLLEMKLVDVEGYGVETDPNVRAIADKFGLNVHIGSIHDNPFPGKQFDLVVMNQVIEHIPEPGALLNVVKSRLKPDGRLILSFPNAGSLARLLSGRKWINWHVPYHQHHFSLKSFSRLASQHGYRVGRVRTVTPNLWTVLQIRALSEETREGQASGSWASGAAAHRQPTLAEWLWAVLKDRLRRGISMGLVAANRAVDAAGKGDSLVVELYPVN